MNKNPFADRLTKISEEKEIKKSVKKKSDEPPQQTPNKQAKNKVMHELLLMADKHESESYSLEVVVKMTMKKYAGKAGISKSKIVNELLKNFLREQGEM